VDAEARRLNSESWLLRCRVISGHWALKISWQQKGTNIRTIQTFRSVESSGTLGNFILRWTFTELYVFTPARFCYSLKLCKYSSAIAERPRCRVGQFLTKVGDDILHAESYRIRWNNAKQDR